MPVRPPGHGHLRASDADRERVVEELKAAYMQGRLSQDELRRRVGETLLTRTYAGLAMLTADIAAEPAAAAPAPETAPVPARKPVSMKAVAWAGAIAVLPALGAAFLTYYGGFFVLFLFAFIGFTITAKA
jgi:Domain of unknown function (DUF1707)